MLGSDFVSSRGIGVPINPVMHEERMEERLRLLVIVLKTVFEAKSVEQRTLPCSPLGTGWLGFLAAAAPDLDISIPKVFPTEQVTVEPHQKRSLSTPLHATGGLSTLMAAAMRNTPFQVLGPSGNYLEPPEQSKQLLIAFLVAQHSRCELCGGGISEPPIASTRNLLGNQLLAVVDQVLQPMYSSSGALDGNFLVFRCGHLAHVICQSIHESVGPWRKETSTVDADSCFICMKTLSIVRSFCRNYSHC